VAAGWLPLLSVSKFEESGAFAHHKRCIVPRGTEPFGHRSDVLATSAGWLPPDCLHAFCANVSPARCTLSVHAFLCCRLFACLSVHAFLACLPYTGPMLPADAGWLPGRCESGLPWPPMRPALEPTAGPTFRSASRPDVEPTVAGTEQARRVLLSLRGRMERLFRGPIPALIHSRVRMRVCARPRSLVQATDVPLALWKARAAVLAGGSRPLQAWPGPWPGP
jgi:hypothetical protein